MLRDAQLDRIGLPGAILDDKDLRRINLQEADLTGASLKGVVAVRGTFTKATLISADLRHADLQGAAFNSADLTRADLRGCKLSPETNFTNAVVTGMVIDLHALRSLGAQRGGLTDGAIGTMVIHDDRVKITQGFGGFWSVLHLLAVVVFLLPYVVFGVRSYVGAQLRPCDDGCIALRQAVWQYILTGGSPQIDVLGLVIFALLAAYNVFRVALVYKVQSIRLVESASGMPQAFTLNGWWWLAYHGCQVLVWINLALVAWHSFELMATRVHP